MKVTINLENLEQLVQTTTEKNIETIIKKQVAETVRKTIDELAKEVIADTVTENFQRFVDEYIKTTTIKVGGNSYWDDEEQKEYTVEQYIKYELKKRLESKKLRVKKKGRTSSYSDDFEEKCVLPIRYDTLDGFAYIPDSEYREKFHPNDFGIEYEDIVLIKEIMEYLESHKEEINDLCVGYDWEDRKIMDHGSDDDN